MNAVVKCNCLARGLTTPPPVPIALDEMGLPFLDFATSSKEDWEQFWSWKQSCCPHRRMNYARESIGTWAAYGEFCEALGRVGPSRLPVLCRELPAANEGLTSPRHAAARARGPDKHRRPACS
jgi:hypothetical protein